MVLWYPATSPKRFENSCERERERISQYMRYKFHNTYILEPARGSCLKMIVRWWPRFRNHLTHRYYVVERKKSVKPQNQLHVPFQKFKRNQFTKYRPLAFVSSVYSTKLLAQVSVFNLFLIGKSNEQYCRKEWTNGVVAFR